MRKLFFILLAMGIAVSLDAATASTSKKNTKDVSRHPVRSVQSTRNMVFKQFTRGSIINGTKATGSVRRWYFFNEGSVGSSYTMLGKSQYVSADLGYNTYIRSIESLFGSMSLMAGVELSVPIYLLTRGKSNILQDHRALETKETDGVAGVGVQLPFMVGLEYNGFYINGLVGYTWLFMKDTYTGTQRGANPTVQTQYDGLIYGGGVGYKISNVVNIGFRYITGQMTNRADQTKFDTRAVSESLDLDSITRNRGKDTYNIPYQRFYAFISYIF